MYHSDDGKLRRLPVRNDRLRKDVHVASGLQWRELLQDHDWDQRYVHGQESKRNCGQQRLRVLVEHRGGWRLLRHDLHRLQGVLGGAVDWRCSWSVSQCRRG